MKSPFDEIGDGIFRRRYRLLDQNVGVVLGAEGVLLVDTRSVPSHAEEITTELRALTKLPVRWVINTHWHWDHVLGNSVFGEAEIWGHRVCRDVMAAEPDEIKAAAHSWLGDAISAELEATEVVPPTRVFDREVELDLGDRAVRLSFCGKAHTDADITVRADDVFFAGDLLEEGVPPVFSDGYPLQWPATIAGHLAAEPARVVVPGHGDVMSPAAAAGQVEELRDVARRCAAATAVSQLDLAGAPYPVETMESAMARSLVERGI